MIVSRTPYRISFFGGGTDYPAWYRQHGGAVLATTIDKYCYLTCRRLPPFFEHRYRVVYSRIDTCRTVDEIRHPSARAVIRHLNCDHGLEIHHDGDLPARSGMGSSSAFTVGLLHALHALAGNKPDKGQLVAESTYIEQVALKETVGSQDQVMAAHGGLKHVVFHPDGKLSVRGLRLSTERLRELNDHLMLFYTGIARTASDVARTYVDDILAKERLLERMTGLVDEACAVLEDGRSISSLGQLLDEAWRLKRSLSSSVTNAEVDEIYEQARGAGALGGKLTGAGGGGFMVLFVSPDQQKAVRERLCRLLQVPFRFDVKGSEIIFRDPGEDYSEAEAVRAKQAISAVKEWTDIEANRRGGERG